MPSPEPPSAISTPEEVRALRDKLGAEGKKLVFTNGCFDLLHAGHVRYLTEARALGDALVIALNSDASVRELKGPQRPVNTEEDRAEILKGLRSVDAVCVFHEPRVTKLIEQIQPHVYAKGGDYTVESLNPEERAALNAVGAKIEILALVPGRSTTKTLQRVKAGETSGPKKLRLGILGSGEGSNFEAIVAAIKAGTLDAEVACVISDIADSGIIALAKREGLSHFIVDPGPHPKRFADSAQKEVCEHLQRADVDVVVLAGFMRILKEPTISTFADRIINVHPSLLPKFKGSHAVQRAIDEGETETGTTVHLVNAEIDGGKILAQAKVPILVGDTAEKLHARIKAKEHQLLPAVLRDWQNQ